MNERWTDDIKNKMEGYNQDPPLATWMEIERTLAAKGLAGAPQQAAGRHRGRRIAIAAAVAAVMGTACWMYSDHTDNAAPGREIAQDVQKNAAGKPAEAAATTTEATAKPAETTGPVRHYAQAVPAVTPNPVAEKTAGAETATAVEDVAEAAQESPVDNTQDNIPAASEATAQPQTSPAKNAKMHKYNDLFADYDLQDQATPKRHHGQLIAKAYIGNAANEHSQGGAQQLAMLSADPIGEFSALLSAKDRNIPMHNATSEITSTKHHQPVRYGVSVRYELGPRWAIESGVTYSYLRSDMSAETDSYKRQTRQTLHYVGIPLSASYSVWRNKGLNIYVTAGAMAEKMVSGKAETTCVSANKQEPTARCNENLSMKQLQWSASGAVGGEYMLTPYFGVYAEPGISYYFDNGSGITTIYKDKPLNFSLNLGLRISLGKKGE